MLYREGNNGISSVSYYKWNSFLIVHDPSEDWYDGKLAGRYTIVH
jgi:hypothetical protein